MLNRPERRNALSRSMVAGLRQGLEDLRLQKDVHAIIVTGKGNFLSSGTDLSEIDTSDELDPMVAAQWHQDAHEVCELYLQCLEHPKPIIAALPGPAFGTGAGLALASDLMLGSPTAGLGLPDTRRGLVAGLVIPLVAFRAGAALASQLSLTGNMLDADACLRHGLFAGMHAEEQLWAAAQQRVVDLTAASAESLSLSKRVLLETHGEQLRAFLASGAAAMATGRSTEAAREGVRAFLEKRAAEWP